MEKLVVTLKNKHGRRVKDGHPWIFSNELQEIPKYEPGSLVEVLDSNKQFIGRGYYNPHSLISVRLLTRNLNDEINIDFFEKKIRNAIEYRNKIYPKDDSYRLIYSEGDLLPGLIVDKYSDHLVIQVLTAGMERWKKEICQVLQSLCKPTCIYERSDGIVRAQEHLETVSTTVFGNLNEDLIIQQDGIQFHVDIQQGQKTGFFFDHRDNRVNIQNLVKGKNVMDLFCGTGSWGIYAAKYSARKVVGIDSSISALELSERNCNLNSFGSICSFIHGDAFDKATELVHKNEFFDVVICDPPAFAKSKQHLPTAIKGYTKINQIALGLLNPGGYLVSSSCSHHIHRELFFNIIQECARKKKISLKLLRYGMQSLDHPILTNIPETDYLKCITLEVAVFK